MNDLIQADCLSILKTLPDKSVDLLCTDPPYGTGIAKSGVLATPDLNRRIGILSIPSAEYFREMLRVSKQQIIWGGNHFAHLLTPSRCWLVWWKKDGLPASRSPIANSPGRRFSDRRRSTTAVGMGDPRQQRTEGRTPDAESARRDAMVHQRILADRRSDPRPLRRLGNDLARRSSARPTLPRHRARRRVS